ncbi:MAG: hypothetical protein H7336_13365 [Bacteriovorax sp.]|nr:hypothetical protein [Bacteriovorax sp.]
MKGTIILRPLEYTIEAIGEKWHQGDKLKGSLKVKNQSAEKIELPLLKVTLYEGHYKKIKAKDAKGWTVVSQNILAETLTLNPSEEKDYSFEFKLAENCSVTDKTGSLYLGFNDKSEIIPTGNIELVVEPKILIQQILQIIENFLRFKVKEIKSGKGMLEVKLNPPASREMSSVDGLVLNISEIEKNLVFKYFFNLRGLDLASATIQVEKKTKEIEQTFTSKQYMIYGDSINQDFIIESVQSVLNIVKTKTL